MPSNRVLGRSLAARAFRECRAAYARAMELYDDPPAAELAIEMALDDVGVQDEPIRILIRSAVRKCKRASVGPKEPAAESDGTWEEFLTDIGYGEDR